MIRLRDMVPGDLPHGLELCRHAGWNQTLEDWQRFLRLAPGRCFVAETGGTIVGTVTTCLLERVGWIATLLVSDSHRRQGTGMALLDRAVFLLREQGALRIRLDATPLGQPLYERRGFAPQFTLRRYGGTLAQSASLDPDSTWIRSGSADELAAIVRLDAEAVGYSRERLLRELFDEQPHSLWVAEKGDRLCGYALSRGGALATQIGPCIATDAEAGWALLQSALARHEGTPVFVDLPEGNAAAARVVQAAGLAPRRELVRMQLAIDAAEAERHERIDWLWASSGPEAG
ncbi:MAG: GNAT family N-acetyltransferase [Pirellulales bacterium]